MSNLHPQTRRDHDTSYDVIIVGFGPAAGFLALLLSQASLRVCILESNDGAHLSPRAVALDELAMRLVVRRAGLMPRFLATSERCPNLQATTDWTQAPHEAPRVLMGDKTAPGQPGAWTRFDPSNGKDQGPMAMWQPQLEMDVRAALAKQTSCTVLFKHTVTAISQVGDGVTVTAAVAEGDWSRDEGREWRFTPRSPPRSVADLRARFVVGCDGARSTVRRLVFGVSKLASFGYDKRWVAADLLLRGPGLDVIGTTLPSFNHHIFGKRQFIIIHGTGKSDMARGKHLRIDFQVLPGDPDLPHAQPFVEHLLVTYLGLKIDPPHVEFVRAASYEFHALVAPQWRSGRVFLAGDACHIMPPFLGQGLNQGLRDVSALAWRLATVARGLAGDGLLDSYQTDRLETATLAVTASAEIGKMAEAYTAEATSPDGNLLWVYYTTKPEMKRFRRGGALLPMWNGDAFCDAKAVFYLFCNGPVPQAVNERVVRAGGKLVDASQARFMKAATRAVLATAELYVFGSVNNESEVMGLLESFEREELWGKTLTSSL